MIELQLAHHRKARVWLNDLPDARTTFPEVSEHSAEAAKALIEEARRAAIEIIIPRGPRALYGLLGAGLNPNQSNALIIRILTSRNVGPLFPDSLALSSDEARVGLPDEFSKAVLEGATNQIVKIGGLGSGELEFGHAAHGLVGSAPIIFNWLAASLVQLLRRGESVSHQELTEILQAPL
jgi:hypothetical protein